MYVKIKRDGTHRVEHKGKHFEFVRYGTPVKGDYFISGGTIESCFTGWDNISPEMLYARDNTLWADVTRMIFKMVHEHEFVCKHCGEEAGFEGCDC